jgi:hypothetical protein
MKADSTLYKYQCDVKYSHKYWRANNIINVHDARHNLTFRNKHETGNAPLTIGSTAYSNKTAVSLQPEKLQPWLIEVKKNYRTPRS